ncbi:MAG TPA: VOC family protein [Myxococcota bacterium]|nr:VOC family protein [Myxococcota bacterium]
MTEIPVLTPPVVPYLTLRDGNAAVAFYEKAFGATLIQKLPAQDGKRLLHASLRLDGGVLMLSDAFPEMGEGGTKAPPTLGGTAVTIHLEVDDADRWWKRAVDAGASVLMPLDNMFWGARYGKVRDPFGHVWSIGGPVK